VVGQDGRLSRQQEGGWRMLSAKDGWNGESATCLVSDLQGAVWIGTALDGLYHWQDGVFTHLGTNEGLASMTISSLLADTKGNLWVGLGTGACVQRLRDGVFTQFAHPQDEFPISSMAEDAAGNIWMASAESRLLRVSGDAIVDETRHALWPPRFILCLNATSDGSLWIGYAGAGLGRLRDGNFSLIGTEQGLLDNYISGIANDDYGNLWFASDRGIFKVRQRELDAAAEGTNVQVLAVAYGRDQSLPNLQANHTFSPASIRTREGKILFPMDSGLAIVHPERAHLNPFVPPALIERMAVEGRDLDIHQSLPAPTLPPGHWNVELEFTALSFASPENVRFRYRLIGWHKDWQETRQRSVSYTRLPAGHYTFEVTACNDFGVWNSRAAALSFRVQPFLWQTLWFRILSALTLGALVSAWARHRERRKHRVEVERLEREAVIERERTRVAQDLHDDLGAGLTEIGLAASLARRQNSTPERIQQHLGEVADKANEMVTALDEIVWAINPRNDSVVSLSHYLCDYAQHFLKLSSIRCRLEVASDLPAWPLESEQRHNLFLAFKESLTNVTHHSQATEVRIRIRSQAEGSSIIEVEDDGRGVTQTPVSGPGANGLTNMVRRLEQIGGRCTIESVPRGGTLVRFVFPCAGAASNKVSV
jgi:signal transduction histidine kinase